VKDKLVTERTSWQTTLALMALLVSSNAVANTVYFNSANGHYYTLTSTVLDWQSAETEALGPRFRHQPTTTPST
jgi:hypothetical protein